MCDRRCQRVFQRCEMGQGQYFMQEMTATHWLNSRRLNAYPRIFLGLYILAILAYLAMSEGLLDPAGKPVGTDFLSFYAAGDLALHGAPESAYSPGIHYQREKTIVGSDDIDYYSFSYPPIFLLLLAPFALLPYMLALALWLGLTLIFYAFMIRRISGFDQSLWLALAFPAVFITLGHGQNAFLTSGLFFGALHYLTRRPVMSGLMISLLTFKPHLGVLLPLFLMVTARWRVFFAAALGTCALISLSVLVYGVETWAAFLEASSLATAVLHDGIVPFHKMQSVFSAMRNLGLGVAASYVIHAGFAGAMLVAAIMVWRRGPEREASYAALILATLAVTPFLLDYDLMLLAGVIVFLSEIGRKGGFDAMMVNMLAAAWLLPLIVRGLNFMLPFPWTALMLLGLMLICVDRSRQMDSAGQT